MKTLVIVFLLLTSLQLFSNEKKIQYYELIGPDKNPGTACLYSLLVPGLGQMYNENVGSGMGLMLGSILGAGLYAFSGDEKLEQTGIIMYGIFYIISVIEAPFGSLSYNRENRTKKAHLRRKYGHLIELSSSNNTLGIDAGLTNKSFGVGISLHF